MSVKSAFLESRFGDCSSVSFCFVAHRFSPFCPLLLTTGLKRMLLKRDCNTIVLPRSSTFLTMNARGSVISLTGGILSWHIPLRRRDMYINLKKAKTCTRFSKEPLLFKWINRVCTIDGFPWNLARTFTDRYETKRCRRILLFQILSSWRSLTQHVTRIFR